ncbi:MAG: histidine kinase dimerization/phospho-acceptor domain-containing protein [Bdellovibrionia bacterium]
MQVLRQKDPGKSKQPGVQGLLRDKQIADLVSDLLLDGIVLLRSDRIVYFNRRGAQILGLPPRALPQDLSLALVGEQYSQEAEQVIRSALSHGTPMKFELKTEQGSFYFLVHAFTFREDRYPHLVLDRPELGSFMSDGDSVADALVLAQDITLVEESKAAKEKFLGDLSHEIKTPLTSLTLATRLLRRSLESQNPSDQLQLIATCIESVDRLRVLIDELLTTSRFDGLTYHPLLQWVDALKLVQNGVHSFLKEFRAKGVLLSFQGSFEAGAVRPLQAQVDPSQLTWVLSIFLSQALRGSEKGDSVKVECRGSPQSFSVQISTPPSVIESLSQELALDSTGSADPLRCHSFDSRGVGLSIAKKIIVAHGGCISLTQPTQQGGLIYFIIPIQSGGERIRTSSFDGAS